ncbi:MAG TPA: START domain-containing protein [Nitrospirota bacterium]|nr:START domain-containing protein [Nitrospirota bacterium]
MNRPHHLIRKAPRGCSPRDSHRLVGWTVWLYITLFALLPHLSHASEWYTVAQTADGIQIFRKEVNHGGLIAFRGIGVVDAPLPLVATVILDTDRRREWIAGLVEAKILRWRGMDNYIEYDHIGLPLIITDRDFVSDVSMSFEPSKKEMVFHYQPSDDPSAPPTDYIRGELINATFNLTAIENDKKTRVDAEFLCNPQGWIPKWLVNFFLKDWPKTTFRRLRKEVLKDFPVDPRFSQLLQRGKIGQ